MYSWLTDEPANTVSEWTLKIETEGRTDILTTRLGGQFVSVQHLNFYVRFLIGIWFPYKRRLLKLRSEKIRDLYEILRFQFWTLERLSIITIFVNASASLSLSSIWFSFLCLYPLLWLSLSQSNLAVSASIWFCFLCLHVIWLRFLCLSLI